MIEHDILGIDRFDRILSIKQEIKKTHIIKVQPLSLVLSLHAATTMIW